MRVESIGDYCPGQLLQETRACAKEQPGCTWYFKMTCIDKTAPNAEQSASERSCPVSRHPNQDTSSKTIPTRSLEGAHIARPSILPYHRSLPMVRAPSSCNNLRSGTRGIYHHDLIVVRKRLLAIEHFRRNFLAVVPV
jgi:hypothetical protein